MNDKHVQNTSGAHIPGCMLGKFIGGVVFPSVKTGSFGCLVDFELAPGSSGCMVDFKLISLVLVCLLDFKLVYLISWLS